MNLCTEPDRQKGGSGEKQGLSLRLAAIFLRNQSIQSLHMLLRFENQTAYNPSMIPVKPPAVSVLI